MKQSMALCLVLSVGTFVAGSGGEKDLPKISDQEFLNKAAASCQAELDVAKLAEKRTRTQNVKEFAVLLLKDHKKIQDQLGELLKNRKTGVIAGTEEETRAILKRLAAQEGTEFDRTFLQFVAKHHREGIQLFESQSNYGEAADVRSFAKSNLPTLRNHLAQAESLLKEFKAR